MSCGCTSSFDGDSQWIDNEVKQSKALDFDGEFSATNKKNRDMNYNNFTGNENSFTEFSGNKQREIAMARAKAIATATAMQGSKGASSVNVASKVADAINKINSSASMGSSKASSLAKAQLQTQVLKAQALAKAKAKNTKDLAEARAKALNQAKQISLQLSKNSPVKSSSGNILTQQIDQARKIAEAQVLKAKAQEKMAVAKVNEAIKLKAIQTREKAQETLMSRNVDYGRKANPTVTTRPALVKPALETEIENANIDEILDNTEAIIDNISTDISTLPAPSLFEKYKKPILIGGGVIIGLIILKKVVLK